MQDLNYDATTKVSLVFNGTDKVTLRRPAQRRPADVRRSTRRARPRTSPCRSTTGARPAKQQNGQDLIGIDNIYLKATRPADFCQKVRPMLNIGAMVEYPRGAGGIVLCNVKFKDSRGQPGERRQEADDPGDTPAQPERAVLRRQDHHRRGANNLTYTPLDLSKQANQYRTDQGWFGDKQFTFADLPRGKQRFAGVPYNVYNFTTSPVPTVVMLGGDGIPGNLPDHVTGIPVGRKADALFFLQAARIDQRRNGDEVKQGKKYEMADYVVHYADGTTAKVPVYAEISVDDYKQKTPAALPGAQIAWTKPYAGTEFSAVAYSMQWNNPSPETR